MKKYLVLVMTLVMLLLISACSSQELGDYIVAPSDVQELLDQGAVLIDAQNNIGAYQSEHIKGAPSITRDMITTFEPYPAAIIGKEAFEEVMEGAGIENGQMVLIYDSNKSMDASRLWWTMKSYGHDEAKVISQGLTGLKEAGFEVSTEPVSIPPSSYQAQEMDSTYYASIDDVINELNYPGEKGRVHLLDVRSQEEYNAGTIPTAILISYEENLFDNQAFRPREHISIKYQEAGMKKDDTIIIFCKSSIRGAQTLLAMYNAGYEDVKLFDGAMLQWQSDPNLPLQLPENAPVQSNQQDES